MAFSLSQSISPAPSGNPEASRMLSRLPRSLVSARGFLVLGFLVFLLVEPIALQNDVIASVFTYSFLLILLVLVVFCLVTSYFIRARVAFSVSASAERGSEGVDQPQLFSQSNTVAIVKMPPLRIPFLFFAEARLRFERGNLKTARHQITGVSQKPRVIREDIVFPHRGYWKLSGLTFSFGDQFGLVSDSWMVQESARATVFRVAPPPKAESAVPILSSCFRSGDVMLRQAERQGERFDLKRYHPSDGMNKIVWKVFARTGQLLSRHPEESMTPEGQVAVFCLAHTGEDSVASEVLAYVKKCIQSDLNIFFGCSGMQGLEVARSVSDTEELIIDCAWNSNAEQPEVADDLKDIKGTIEKVRQILKNSVVSQLVLFFSEGRLRDQRGLNHLKSLGEGIEKLGIEPVFVQTPERRLPVAVGIGKPVPSKSPRLAIRLRDLFIIPKATAQSENSTTLRNDFARVCAAKKWKLILA